MRKIKVIVKRPDETYGHVTRISNTLENLQKTVEGYIETVPLTTKDVIICNEEGKLKNLPRNIRMYGDTVYSETLVGNIIVAGVSGDEFSDINISFDDWKRLIDKWEG